MCMLNIGKKYSALADPGCAWIPNANVMNYIALFILAYSSLPMQSLANLKAETRVTLSKKIHPELPIGRN